jgi:DNA-binding NtrC family response regulator
LIRRGLFRSDLYYRLAEYDLDLPAVRDLPEKKRRELIVRLVESISQEHGATKTVSDESLAKMAGFCWPGNVRQINFLLKRVYLLSDGAQLSDKKIAQALENLNNRAQGDLAAGPDGAPWDRFPLLAAVDLYRDYRVKKALGLSKGNKTLAAKSLGVNIQTLNNYANKVGQSRAKER